MNNIKIFILGIKRNNIDMQLCLQLCQLLEWVIFSQGKIL